MRRRIHACHMRRRILACHMRGRIHSCHMVTLYTEMLTMAKSNMLEPLE